MAFEQNVVLIPRKNRCDLLESRNGVRLDVSFARSEAAAFVQRNRDAARLGRESQQTVGLLGRQNPVEVDQQLRKRRRFRGGGNGNRSRLDEGVNRYPLFRSR